jgi:hypothetical protein
MQSGSVQSLTLPIMAALNGRLNTQTGMKARKFRASRKFYFREPSGDLTAFGGDTGSTLRSSFKPGPGSLGAS